MSCERTVLTYHRLKLKRPQTAKYYRTELDLMYKRANEEEIAGHGVATMKARL